MTNLLADIKSLAKITLNIESEAIKKLISYIDDSFFLCLQDIDQMPGRLIVSGIGKSALIGQKMVATFNSTGTPAIFMHAADAIHGDLGMVQPGDIVMLISKSGNTPEIKALIPYIKNMGNKLIALVGNVESELATQANYVINSTVDQEACPNNLAPTTSTTAQLAMGDTMAVCLLKMRGFTGQDFARFHPGGSLGKQLYLRAKDLSAVNAKPVVNLNQSAKEVLLQISKGRLGIVAVLDDFQKIKGVITDGDIRRLLEKTNDISNVKAQNFYSSSFKSIDSESMATEALQLMRNHSINQLVVLKEGNFDGFIHIQDLIREGLI
jgi:arabinose-5-phosphate isomerase